MDYIETARQVKADSYTLAGLSTDRRNEALAAIAEALTANKEEIFAANRRDLENGSDLPGPILGRLRFDEHKLSDVLAGISGLIELDDPIGKTLLERELDDDLILTQVTCPIGVIGIIFESRPDALVQVSALCIKSGNAVILKGGSEAKETNRALFDVIRAAGIEAGLPENFAAIIEDRAGINEIIKCRDEIDLLIPRGSNQFVQYIMDNSDIPVMGHAGGICHIYVDKAADIRKAIPIIIDAKTQYVSACNAAETLILHEDVADEVLAELPGASDIDIEIIPAKSDDDFCEYLDYKMTVMTVSDIDDAIAHINKYGSHHTDAIITEDPGAAEIFLDEVDSAGVYWNVSTRFADGFRYGFGAEVGISTGKLPPRGPIGLDGLVTYKYKIRGNGQIVGDYASGKSTFKFKDIIPGGE
ncbi:MAG: glutamate-5-semialdehyde dehydrogenase [Eubacteriaceae bacterium]|jgi:glutamate-5-semialdehyde dehydrogenase|nr:glutamate-5-semialdehyde dehydrogenase [Eubacteriaceae bacterium]